MLATSLPMRSDDTAISVRNLTKSYRLFGHPGDRIKRIQLHHATD